MLWGFSVRFSLTWQSKLLENKKIKKKKKKRGRKEGEKREKRRLKLPAVDRVWVGLSAGRIVAGIPDQIPDRCG